MMTAAMMKADTRPARRGSNPGELWAVPRQETPETHQLGPFFYYHSMLSKHAGNAAFREDLTLKFWLELYIDTP